MANRFQSCTSQCWLHVCGVLRRMSQKAGHLPGHRASAVATTQPHISHDLVLCAGLMYPCHPTWLLMTCRTLSADCCMSATPKRDMNSAMLSQSLPPCSHTPATQQQPTQSKTCRQEQEPVLISTQLMAWQGRLLSCQTPTSELVVKFPRISLCGCNCWQASKQWAGCCITTK